MRRGHLTDRARPGSTAAADVVADVVAGVCGVQAQLAGAAELSVGVRVDDVTRDDVRAALWERRTLVRVWAMRGTVHLLPAAELPLWMAALDVTPLGTDPAWLARHGLVAGDVDAVVEAIGEALSGRALLREELAEEVVARVGKHVRAPLMSGWGVLLMPATRRGLLCHGPARGSKATFVRADEWIGGWREHDPREALAEVYRRFLATYGPARAADIERWTGAPLPADVAATVDTVEVAVGRRRCVALRDDPFPDEGGDLPVRLLPKYDCYVLGSYPRETAVPKEVGPRLRAHPRGRYEGAAGHSTLLVDGVVAGVWERRGDVVRVEPYRELDARLRAGLEAEVVRLASFDATPAELSIGPLP